MDRADTPGTAAFEKRVTAFCNGKGFDAGPWPDWDTSSPSYIAKQMAALSPDERAEAEKWRDPYLLDIASRKRRPVPVGVFLHDRMWTRLDARILERADRLKAAKLKPDERPKPDGWAPCMGPVGMAWLFSRLLAGPECEADGPVLMRSQMQRVWPDVARWQDVLNMRGGLPFDACWHGLKGAMEAVPPGDVLDAWRREFDARGWPWLAPFDKAEVVYCPKGGPAGLDAFAEAAGKAAAETGKGKAA